MTATARQRLFFFLLALLMLALALGCKRRDDLADISLDLGPGVEPHAAQPAPVAPLPTPAPETPKEEVPPPGPTRLDPAQAFAHIEPLTRQTATAAGTAFVAFRIGACWVAALPAEPLAALSLDGKPRPALAVPPDTGLTLWASDGSQGPPLCEASPHPGEALLLVTPGEALSLAVTVTRAAAPLPSGAITGTERLLVLDRPALPQLAGALLLDAEKRLCGLVTTADHRGLMTAIGPEELRLWQSSPDTWRKRYPVTESPQPLAPSDAPIQPPTPPDAPIHPLVPPDETSQDPPTPDETSPGWSLPLAHAQRWLGLTVQELTPQLRQAFELEDDAGGLLVTRVHPRSPAQRAGLREADIVQQINDTPVHRVDQLPPLIDALELGQHARLMLLRDGLRLTAELPLAPRPGGQGGLRGSETK